MVYKMVAALNSIFCNFTEVMCKMCIGISTNDRKSITRQFGKQNLHNDSSCIRVFN